MLRFQELMDGEEGPDLTAIVARADLFAWLARSFRSATATYDDARAAMKGLRSAIARCVRAGAFEEDAKRLVLFVVTDIVLREKFNPQAFRTGLDGGVGTALLASWPHVFDGWSGGYPRGQMNSNYTNYLLVQVLALIDAPLPLWSLLGTQRQQPDATFEPDALPVCDEFMCANFVVLFGRLTLSSL